MYDDSDSDFFKPIIGFHFGFDPGQVGVSNDNVVMVEGLKFLKLSAF